MVGWNPWHGCHKFSEGCRYCYVYRMDARYERDSSQVVKTSSFDLPVRRNKKDEYKIAGGQTVFTCFSSDFFVEDADPWRFEAWQMMRERHDLNFLLITKRIERFNVSLPADWGDGYENVVIGCTVENQKRADQRLPIFRQAPIRHKVIIAEPLLGPMDISSYLGDWVEEVSVGGESGPDARLCKYDWILDIRRQCIAKNVTFCFRQTGAHFMKDGRLYNIKRINHHQQAKKAGIDYQGAFKLPPRG